MSYWNNLMYVRRNSHSCVNVASNVHDSQGFKCWNFVGQLQETEIPKKYLKKDFHSPLDCKRILENCRHSAYLTQYWREIV